MALSGDGTQARSARVNDFWLGGSDHLAPDRRLARDIEALFPPPKPGRLPNPQEVVLEARAFTGRAVRWAAARGITQFLDLGTLLPTSRTVELPAGRTVTVPSTHEAAGPGAMTLYVRADPLIASHVGAIDPDDPAVGVVCADPFGAAAQDAAAAQLDLSRPVAVVLVRTLDFLPADEARKAVRGWLEMLAPGSCLIIGCAHVDPPAADPDLWEKIAAAYTIGPVFSHSVPETLSFFEGTLLASPGLVVASAWGPDRPVAMEPDTVAWMAVGVGVKPRQAV